MNSPNDYGRWAAFEAAVLDKIDPDHKCLPLIRRRQNEVDDDAHESHLVACHIRNKLTTLRLDPESCCVFLTTAEIGAWLKTALNTKFSLNKVTPNLKSLGIPEMSYTARTGVPGWRWRGKKAKPKAKFVAL